MLSPAAVTMTSFLRPRKRRLPSASTAAMSPVATHSESVGTMRPLLPCGARNSFAANQNFAVVGDAHFAPGHHFADAAAGRLEGMVQTDQRRRFGHAVALHNREAETQPELLRLGIERRAATDKGPELQVRTRDGHRETATISSTPASCEPVPSAPADRETCSASAFGGGRVRVALLRPPRCAHREPTRSAPTQECAVERTTQPPAAPGSTAP